MPSISVTAGSVRKPRYRSLFVQVLAAARPLGVGRRTAMEAEIPGLSGVRIQAASNRTFCAPFQSTVLPSSGSRSSPRSA